MKRASVLYLSYDGLTDPLGQSQILPYLKNLAPGYAIHIISFEKRDRFAAEGARMAGVCSEIGIAWHPLRYHKFPPVLSTLFDLWRLRWDAGRLHRKHKFGIVHCRSYVTSLVGLWFKKRHAVRFIFDMRGFWADERVEGDIWNLKNPVFRMIYSFFKKKEREFVSRADHVVALTEKARVEISSWQLATKVTVIPCCADPDLFDPGHIKAEARNNLRSELGLRAEDFVLLYLGSWGTWYQTNEMLQFFGMLRESVRGARLLLVTPDAPDLTDCEFKDAVLIRSVPRKEVPLFISLASAGICFILPSFSKKASSATKLAEMLMMGLPVVSNEGWGDVDLYTKTLPGFIAVKDKADYPGAIEKLLQSHSRDQIRAGASDAFSLDQGCQRYGVIYHALV